MKNVNNQTPSDLLAKIIKVFKCKEIKQKGKIQANDDGSISIINEDDEIESEVVSPSKSLFNLGKKHLKTALSRFKNLTELLSYNLSESDILAIAQMWKGYLSNHTKSNSWVVLCETAGLDTLNVTKCYKFIKSLYERKIIKTDDDDRTIDELTYFSFIKYEYVFKNDFITVLLGYSVVDELDKSMTDWKNDAEFFADLKKCMENTLEVYGRMGRYDGYFAEISDPIKLFDSLDLLVKRLDTHKDKVQLAKVIIDHELDTIETYFLLVTTYFTIQQDSADLQELLRLVSCNRQESIGFDQNLSPTAKLLKNNLIEVKSSDGGTRYGNVSLSAELLGKLSIDYGSQDTIVLTGEDKLLEFIKGDKAFNIVKCSQKIDQLIISDNEKNTLITFVKKLSEPEKHNLSSWGFKGKTDDDIDNDRHKGFIALFFGEPGTGKTFAAGAIANELDRPLVSLDCTKIFSYFYGQTEKLVKNAFEKINKISSKSDTPPVFLINEADQLINKRIESRAAADKTDNSVQNIILEALETFPGIMILTTNFIDLIDDAYFRRFNLKMEFTIPDLECRKKLWKLHLKKEIPGVDSIDVDYLSGQYVFTGGEIANVIQNACSEAIIRTCNEKRLKMDDLIKYCELETPWQRANNVSNQIGFGLRMNRRQTS